MLVVFFLGLSYCTTLRQTVSSISNSAEHDSKVDTARLLQLVLGIAINCEHKDSKMCGATSCVVVGSLAPYPGLLRAWLWGHELMCSVTVQWVTSPIPGPIKSLAMGS